MSEKKIKIETAPQPEFGGMQPIAAATAPPAEEKTKRKGLPADGEPWKASEHDMVVMGRLSRAIEGVPPAAMRRIAPWFTSLLTEAMREPQREYGLVSPMAQELRAEAEGKAGIAPWNAAARAYGQG